MSSNTSLIVDKLPGRRAYLLVTLLNDGRYRVEFRKEGQGTRVSFTPNAHHMAQQAKRAGNIPVHTSNIMLQQACRDQQVTFIDESV